MSSEKEKTRKGIAAYAREQEVLLEVIRENGGSLTQKETEPG